MEVLDFLPGNSQEELQEGRRSIEQRPHAQRRARHQLESHMPPLTQSPVSMRHPYLASLVRELCPRIVAEGDDCIERSWEKFVQDSLCNVSHTSTSVPSHFFGGMAAGLTCPLCPCGAAVSSQSAEWRSSHWNRRVMCESGERPRGGLALSWFYFYCLDCWRQQCADSFVAASSRAIAGLACRDPLQGWRPERKRHSVRPLLLHALLG